MDNNKHSISRKDALKRLGELTLGLPFVPSMMNNFSLENKIVKKKNTIKNGKPNILWITTEGVPLSVLSCYGSRLMKTPNIDRIA